MYIYNKCLYNFCRYTFNENRLALKKLQQKYDNNIIRKIANATYNYHKDKSIMCELDTEGEVVYEEIVEKYNDQLNLKWSGMLQIINMVLITESYLNFNNVLIYTLISKNYMYITQDHKKT